MMSRFAPRMFRLAAVYGVLVLVPLYFLPLPLHGGEVYLGFVGLALVFQAVFWVIGGNPRRYRALMLPAVAEKLVFALPALWLWTAGRTAPLLALFAAIDLILAAGFYYARRLTPPGHG